MPRKSKGASKQQEKVPVTKTKRRIFRKKELFAMKIKNKKVVDGILDEIINKKKFPKKRQTIPSNEASLLDTFLRDFNMYSQNYQATVDSQVDVNNSQKFEKAFNHLVVKLCESVKSLQFNLNCMIKSFQQYGDDEIIVKELQRIYFCCWLCTDYLAGYQGSCDAVAGAKRTVTIGCLIEQLNSFVSEFYKRQPKGDAIDRDNVYADFDEFSDSLLKCLNYAVDIRFYLNKNLNIAAIKKLKVEESLKETGLILDFLCYFSMGFIKKYFFALNQFTVNVETMFKKYQTTFSSYDKSLDWQPMQHDETSNALPSNSLQFTEDDSCSSNSSNGHDAYFDNSYCSSNDEFTDENKSDKIEENQNNCNRRSSLRPCKKVIDYSYKEDLRRIVFVEPKSSSQAKKAVKKEKSLSENSNSRRSIPNKSVATSKDIKLAKKKEISSKAAKKGKKLEAEKEKNVLVELRSQSLIELPTQKDTLPDRGCNSMRMAPKRKLYSPTSWLNSSYIKKLQESLENE